MSRSRAPGADVDYLFAQVSVTEARVDTRPNCGNMLAGVGPFAIEAGLVTARDPETVVRIFNVNTSTLVEAVVQTPGGRVEYDGDARIDGVNDPAAPIKLSFLNAMGAVTGRLLPTGRALDVIDGVEASCVDMAMPVVIMAAEALGKTGKETPADLDADRALLARIESIRRKAGELMGMGDVSGLVVPKPVLASAPSEPGGIASRYFTPHACHRSHAATGALAVGTAAALAGTIASRFVRPAGFAGGRLRIEHPAGAIPIDLEMAGQEVKRASLVRTARRIFEGAVLVPDPI